MQDIYGRMKMTKKNSAGEERIYRLKFQDKSVRYERQITLTDGHKEWLRVASVYYSQINPIFEDAV